MRIALHDSDSTNFPSLPLMKLAAWHKAKRDTVERFVPLFSYDAVYSSKVFSWTPQDAYLPAKTQKGGTGYGQDSSLPDEIEHICPDYNFYGVNFSIGFLTRGCIRSCSWCLVPKKEGTIRPHADIEEFTRHRNVVLMDNNVLAHDYGIEQIEEMARLGLRVDFNQGLDARLIDAPIAKRLAALGWFKPLRLACDHKNQIPEVEKAVKLLRAAGTTPKAYFCYVLVKDVNDAEERVMFLQALGLTPFAQPYRDYHGTPPTQEQKDFARWCNRPWLRKAVSWKHYTPRKRATA